ncbi:NAD(+)/NADH kinase [Candidatus Parcubacteria bacterium]|nr:NAD(+)/NADH kinase [Candidatus Parcubacteria bacterium]
MRLSLSVDQYNELAKRKLNGIRVWLECKGHKVLKRQDEPEAEITFGGDGNTIRVVSACSQLGIPVLSINAGNVGFLTYGDIANWEESLEIFLDGKYKVEKRLGLGFIYKKKQYGPFANDVYFRCTRGVAYFNIWKNKVLTYRNLAADGIIVSTPTGSTGYNQGAGGPICAPGVSIILVTPICPTVVNSPPLVVSSNTVIKIDVLPCRKLNSALLIADGREIDELKNGGSITIKIHPTKMMFIALDGSNFYQALQTKKGLRK